MMQPVPIHKPPPAYFLFLLPAFYVFHGYVENRDVVSVADAFLLGSTYFAGIILASLISKLIFRSWQKAFVYILLVAILCLFFGAIHDSLKTISGDGIISTYRFLIPVYIIAFISLMVWIYKKKTTFRKLTLYANWLFAILIGMDLVKMAISRPETQTITTKQVDCRTCNKPDIYLIVADEYAGQEELKQVMNFSNDVFLGSLEDLGFHVIKNSRSNYNSTPYSIASLLAMDYLHDNPGRAAHRDDLNKAYRLINQNDVFKALKTNGYTIVNHSIFKLDNQRPLVSSMFLTVGKRVIDVHTLWGRMNRDLRFQLITKLKWSSEIEALAGQQIKSNELLIDRTKSIANEQSGSPKFVYTHLMLPHFPYLFDRNGKAAYRENIPTEDWSRQEQYTEYLQYSNKRLIELVSHIKKGTRGNAVILLMSDHGFRQFNDERRMSPLVFMNLNAIYLPSKQYGAYYHTMSNVNQFRILFQQLFSQSLPVLNDSTILLP